jgi:hypothetical protein
MAYAKLFGPDDNQVLVLLDQSDEGPCVKIHCQPPGLGICATTFGFPEKEYATIDEAWTKAEKCFAEMDESRATKVADALKAQVADLTDTTN